MKPPRYWNLVVIVNCAVPATLLGWDAWRGQLGANPVNFAIRTTGMLALIFLLLSLAVTPASRIRGGNRLVPFRRILGLAAFFHGVLHLLIFYAYDRALSVHSTIDELIKRPYLTIGAASLAMMLPLAVTSTNRMIKRLGAKRWKRLHRLAYPAAVAGVTHYYLLVKADVRQPLAFAFVLALLLISRLRRRFEPPMAPIPRMKTVDHS